MLLIKNLYICKRNRNRNNMKVTNKQNEIIKLINDFEKFALKNNKKIFKFNDNIHIEFNNKQNLGFDYDLQNSEIYAYTWINKTKKQKNKTKFLIKQFINFCFENNIKVENF